MMLAEKLLLEKSITLPVREREVLHSLETIREPKSIAMRRQAKKLWISDVQKSRLDTVGANDPAWTANDPGWAKLIDTVKKGGAALELIDGMSFESLREAVANANVPPEYHQYLTRETENQIAYDVEALTKALISTGAIYRLDGGEAGTQGVLDSIFGGLPIGELPPLPYPRMWFEGRGKDGEYVPLWEGSPGDAWNADDSGVLWGMAISEIETGQSWGVVAVRQESWIYEAAPNVRPGWLTSLRYERLDASDLTRTPRSEADIFVGKDHDYGEMIESELAYRGAMVAWALVLADIVTARNVDRREEILPKRTLKQIQRRSPGGKFPPKVYQVYIATATDDAKEETNRALHVRFLVRGHWRISKAPHARWIESKEGHCVWVHAHVKGPPGAPWKGRPIYVEPKES